MLWYNKFKKDLESIGFEFNPYDPCVANRIVNGKQQTVRFHVDDLMSSHVDRRVNDKFVSWLEKQYGEHGKVKASRDKVQDFLGMDFDFRTKGKLKIDMSKYMKKMVDDFEKKYVLKGAAVSPAANDLFANNEKSPKLEKEMKGVRSPSVDDWHKLLRYMQYVKRTWKDVLTLSADNLNVVKWYVDASFAVHPDFRSHTASVMSMGEGAVQSNSSKQKLNTRSSTEAELVGCDDAITKILWTRLFIQAQGYEVKENILYQDNKSTILLATNGRNSAGKRSRAINIRYFFIADQQQKGFIRVKYCPTKQMWADPLTKPLQGSEFKVGADRLMGRTKD